MTASPLPLLTLRAMALHAQALDVPPAAPATRAAILALVQRLGCVQIDTLQMVARSQYLLVHSRLGQYDTADFDALLFDPADRQLYEYWLKAASIIPLEHYRYSLPQMRAYREGGRSRWGHWLSDDTNAAVLAEVRARLAAEGGLRGADFAHDKPRKGSWWNWKPAKRALEYLYDTGEVMIADRVNFQRVYDLRERVLPAWVDTTEPTEEEMLRFRVEMAARGLGIAEPLQLAEYAYLKRTQARGAIADLMADGTLHPVTGLDVNGEPVELVVHRANLPLLEQAAAGAIIPRHTAFLTPFDSLFWARGRDERFWNFRNVLEAYKREPDRIWGYFCLPILHGDRLVGRFDPKLERKTGTLRLKALHLEPGIVPDDDLIVGVAGAMRTFMTFHSATDLVIEERGSAEFRQRLLAAL